MDLRHYMQYIIITKLNITKTFKRCVSSLQIYIYLLCLGLLLKISVFIVNPITGISVHKRNVLSQEKCPKGPGSLAMYYKTSKKSVVCQLFLQFITRGKDHVYRSI